MKGTYGDMKRFARVQLDGPESYIAITDSTGRFSFQEVIQGRYKITVTQGNNVQIFSQTVSTGTLDLMVNW